MEAVLEFEPPVEVELGAVEVRERLVGFVDEITCGLPHARQRENAGLYVRGLVEQGGRKSLQPTLFRLGETRRGTSRCSSSWPIRRGILRCLCGLCGAGCSRDRRGGVGV